MGRLDGLFRQYYENGTIAREGQYARGRPTGTHRVFLAGGSKHIEKKYGLKKHPDVTHRLPDERTLELRWDQYYQLIGSVVDCYAKKFCAVDYRGAVRCITIDELVDLLGRALDPASVENVLGAINEIYDVFSLDPQKSLLVSCNGGIHAIPTGARVTDSSSPFGAKKTLASPGELNGMTAACRSSVTAPSEGGSEHRRQ